MNVKMVVFDGSISDSENFTKPDRAAQWLNPRSLGTLSVVGHARDVFVLDDLAYIIFFLLL